MGAETTAPGHILLVGPDEATSEWEALLSSMRWQYTRYPSSEGVLLRLRDSSDVDLVVLVPGTTFQPYAKLCRDVKLDPRTAFVAVVFLLPPVFFLPVIGPGCRAKIFASGADDCIQLPAPPQEIQVRLSNALHSKKATDSLEDATSVITSLANAIEGRDKYTRGHVERVSAYCVELGQRLDVDDADLYALRLAGTVHDIGKVVVPDFILNKPAPLTEEEMQLIKRHPIAGCDILQPLRTLQVIRPLVRWHHERPNGTGYPDGLSDSHLPLLPRIVAVADFFDAVSTARPYHPAYPPDECRHMLQHAAANGDLDTDAADALLQILGNTTFEPVAAAGSLPPVKATAL